jgi:hypothetical protein
VQLLAFRQRVDRRLRPPRARHHRRHPHGPHPLQVRPPALHPRQRVRRQRQQLVERQVERVVDVHETTRVHLAAAPLAHQPTQLVDVPDGRVHRQLAVPPAGHRQLLDDAALRLLL